MNDWSKPASDLAARIGTRAVERLIDHGVFALTDRDRHLIARACALAVDEVLGYQPHEIRAPQVEGSDR